MHTDAKHYYAILGVETGCSDELVRAAFRRRAKELHPDAETGDASAFIRLRRAYDVLGDPARRARYDRECVPRPLRFAEVRVPPPRPARRGGAGPLRLAVAFVLMACISIGGVEWMISDDHAPAIKSAPLVPIDSLLSPSARERAAGRSRHGEGWDPAAGTAGAPNGDQDESGPSSPTALTRD